jgi:hypothetical protein
MMKAADQGRLDDPALIAALHESGLRGVLVEGKVGSGTVVVDEVVAQQATQVGRVEDDDVIEALPAQGADEAFDMGFCQGGPWGDLDLVDPQGVHPAGEHRPVHSIAVAQEVARHGLPRERLHELLGRPLGRGASVTLTCRTRRRSWARTTRTNNTLNIAVETVKKSTETRLPTWLARNVRQVCEGGVRRRGRYLETVA